MCVEEPNAKDYTQTPLSVVLINSTPYQYTYVHAYVHTYSVHTAGSFWSNPGLAHRDVVCVDVV